MADVIALIRTDCVHILRWQAALGYLRHQPTCPGGADPPLAWTWHITSCLIDWHMSAQDDICGPVLSGTGPPGLCQASEVRAEHQDIRELLAETSLQPPGTPRWWQLAEATLAAWASQADREGHGFLAGLAGCTGPGWRQRLGRQWVAFMNARVLDQYPHAPAGLTACQLRRAHILRVLPRLDGLCPGPLFCSCPACAAALERIMPATQQAPGLRAAAALSRLDTRPSQVRAAGLTRPPARTPPGSQRRR